MNDETTTAAPEATAAPELTVMDRALDALTKAPDAPPTEAAPPAPPVEPPKPTPPAPPQVDPAQVRATQERVHAELSAKLERDRAALEEQRKALDASRSEVERAKALSRMATDDPARFLRETGQDPVKFAQRLADRERLSEVARAEIDTVQAEAKRTREELDTLRKQLEERQAESAKLSKAQAVAQMREVASAKHQAAAHYLASGQVDEGYLDALADEVRTEKGFVTLEAVSERLDLRMREAARSLLETPWGREMAAELAKASSPTVTAPTGQASPTAHTAPKTLTRSVTDARTTAPAARSSEDRLERALDLMTGRATR